MPLNPITGASKLTDFLVDRSGTVICLVLLATALLLTQIPKVEFDSTLRAFYESDSREYELYRRFADHFGSDEFILIAIKYRGDASAGAIGSLDAVTKKLEKIHGVSEAVALTNISLLGKKGECYGPKCPARDENGRFTTPCGPDLDIYRKALPFLNALVSADLHTFGIVVNIDESAMFGREIGSILKQARRIVARNIPKDATFRITGGPVLREAFVKYNVRSVATFGVLGCLIGGLAALYIFRSFRFGLTVTAVVALCILWLLGFMGLLNLKINTSVTMAFGIIPIVGTATLIHIITHYNRCQRDIGEPTMALKKALGTVGRPCLMCAVTTSVGFGSLMVSPLPMVRQVGMILSSGVMATFFLAMTVAPFVLLLLKPLSTEAHRRISGDLVSVVQQRALELVFSKYKWIVACSFVAVCVMLGAVPWIRTGIEPLEHFRRSTPEVQDVLFVRDNLSSIRRLELVVEGDPAFFRKPRAWREVAELESRLKRLHCLTRVESLAPLLMYTHGQVTQSDAKAKDFYDKPGVIPELLALIGLSERGGKLLDRYIDKQRRLYRISLWLVDSSVTPVDRTLSAVKDVVDKWRPDDVKAVWITGLLAVYAAQVQDLLASQVISLLIALIVITLLMIVQLRSTTLGLLSLIPNITPIFCIFGLMAWLKISLNSMTIFAATAAIGLAVDDTIHYLTQLKRELSQAQGHTGVEESIANAYRTTSRAMISTSIVLCLGFLTLLLSPFEPLASFGVLLSAGIVIALVADILVMPALILWSPWIKRLLEPLPHAEPIRNP